MNIIKVVVYKIPKVKELNAEYGELLSMKRDCMLSIARRERRWRTIKRRSTISTGFWIWTQRNNKKRIKRSGRDSAEVWGICHFGSCPSFLFLKKLRRTLSRFWERSHSEYRKAQRGLGHSPTGRKSMGCPHALLANLRNTFALHSRCRGSRQGFMRA